MPADPSPSDKTQKIRRGRGTRLPAQKATPVNAPQEAVASGDTVDQPIVVVSSRAKAKGAVGLPTTVALSAKEQRADLARIVRRLEAIVTNHLEGARRIHHPLTLAQVIAIIDALRAEAEGTSRPVAFSDGEVTFYLMDGLYEELLGEPSNIFYSTAVAEGVTRYEPLQRDFWVACLAALRQRMERLGF